MIPLADFLVQYVAKFIKEQNINDDGALLEVVSERWITQAFFESIADVAGEAIETQVRDEKKKGLDARLFSYEHEDGSRQHIYIRVTDAFTEAILPLFGVLTALLAGNFTVAGTSGLGVAKSPQGEVPCVEQHQRS